MKRVLFIIFLFISPVLYAGSKALPWVELNIKPSVETKTDSLITLMPKEEELIEGDAVPLYKKALDSIPKDFDPNQFPDWRKLPSDIDQLPIKEIETETKKVEPVIDLLNQAAKCKQCNWPFKKPEQITQKDLDDLKIYRQLSFVLDVKAKLQIIQRQYDSAIETIKTNLKMANNFGGAPYLNYAMVGISMEAINLQRIEEMIQTKDAPNLYFALKKLPQPLADLNKAIKVEKDNLKNYNILTRILLRRQLEPAHEQVLKQMNHIDRKAAALQIIEAIRLYAGKHKGQLPNKLSDITDVEIPKDPVTKKQFEYKSTGSEAVLQIEGTEGSDGRDSVRYEIKLK
ncbi:MAG: hypothetical protein JW787_15400 [Sedimentisphaerales bacterium]|nr:hypothetical protein [Sedimentisphaerales bacterium]